MSQDSNSDTLVDAALDDLVGYNLKRVYMIFQADFREAVGQDGFSPRAYAALSLTIQRPQITQSELARGLGIERSGLVAIIDHLEELGLIKRKPVPGDRRVQALHPTEKGRQFYADATERVVRHEERLLCCLEKNEQKVLMDILAKLRKVNSERK